jgi:hypothetical protein
MSSAGRCLNAHCYSAFNYQFLLERLERIVFENIASNTIFMINEWNYLCFYQQRKQCRI